MSTRLLIVFLCRPDSAPCKLYPVTITPLTNSECVQMHYNYSQDVDYRGGRRILKTTI